LTVGILIIFWILSGKKTILLLNKKCQIRVKVANGEEVLSEGKCSELQMQLRNMSFRVDSYVIILVGCDMVLGIQMVSNSWFDSVTRVGCPTLVGGD
jgi:hypothetical protein